jgi:hypothetical protein
MPRNAPIHVPPTRSDHAIADACYPLAGPKIEPVFRGLTWLADEKLMLASLLVAWLGIRALSTESKFGRMADQMLCSMAIAAALPHIIKLAFARLR